MKSVSTYYAIVNGISIEADTLLQLRKNIKSFIDSCGLTWNHCQGLYRVKNGKIYLIGNR